MNNIAAEPKKDNTARNVGAGTAVSAAALMSVDRRPKVNEKTLKHFQLTSKNYSRYLKPGDVLVGSPSTPDQAMSNYFKSLKSLKKIKIGKGFVKSVKKSVHDIDPATPLSKTIHSIHSHGEIVLSPNETAFAGGYNTLIDETLHHANRKKSGVHYTIMRPTHKGQSALFPDVVSRAYGGELLDKKNYTMMGGIKSGIKNFITPKFRTNERVKSKKVLAREACQTKGHCATLGALASKRTIGGKTAKNILPEDFLRSKEWKAVGTFGVKPTDIKTKFVNKLMLNSPKYIARGAVAATVGAGVYGATKAIQSLMKTRKHNDVATHILPINN